MWGENDTDNDPNNIAVDQEFQNYYNRTGPNPLLAVNNVQAQLYNRTQTRSALWQQRQALKQQDMAAAAGLQAGGQVLGQTMGGMFGMISQGMKNRFEGEQKDKDRTWNNLDREDKQSFQQEMIKMALQNQMSLDQNRMSQAQSMYQFELGSKQEALKQAGLPAYLAQMPGAMSAIPRMSQRLPGGRLYTSQIAGDPTTSQFMGTPIQASLGWGKLPSFN